MAISRSDMNRQLYDEGGIITLDQAKEMAPPGESLAYINPEEAALLKSLGGAGEDINGTGIKSYFFKKIFRKAKKAVKKVVKSPIGKIALLGAATLPFGGPGAALKGLGGLFGKGGGIGKLLGGMKNMELGKQLGLIGGIGGLGGLLAAKEQDEDEIDVSDIDRGEGMNIPDIVRRAKLNDPEFRFLPGSQFTNAYAEGGEVGGRKMMVDRLEVEVMPDESEERAMLDAMMNDIDEVMPEDRKREFYKLLIPQLRKSGEMSDSEYEGLMGELFGEGKADGGIMKAKRGLVNEPGSYAGKKLKDVDKMSRRTLVKNLNSLELPETNASEFDDNNIRQILIDFAPDIFKGSWGSNSYAKGGEVADGGIMNLGGNEMDLRGGGFVPLGAKEKADDVPARLSKNEFVFTADAVRAAGGGSVDKGADKMYKTMKSLEAQV